MKINEEFVLREIAGEAMLIPVGETAGRVNGMVTLNETAAFIWKELAAGKDETGVLKAMLESFEVEEATARADLSETLEALKRNGLIEG